MVVVVVVVVAGLLVSAIPVAVMSDSAEES